MQPTKIIIINPRSCYIGIAYREFISSENPNTGFIEAFLFSSNGSKFFDVIPKEDAKNRALLFPNHWLRCLSEDEFDKIFYLISSNNRQDRLLAGQLIMMFKGEYEQLAGIEIKAKNQK